MQNQPPSAPLYKRYYPSSRAGDMAYIGVGFLVLFTNIFVFVILSIMGGTGLLEIRWMNGLLSIIVLTVLATRIYAHDRVCLIVSTDGIEYRQVGYQIRATWKDIEYIGPVPGFRVKVGEGLILRQSGLQANKWQRWLAVPLGRSFHRYIPLFVKDWRESELGQDLRHYAPHLFIEAEKK